MKPMHLLIVIYILATIVNNVVCGFFSTIKKYSLCQVMECCNEDYIIGNMQELKYLLNQNIYGQHIAKEIVLHAITSHLEDKSPRKALTMSFHGWPGSGKNYVTKFIKKAMYRNGKESNYVHEFTARIHFPLSSKVNEYQENLQNWIRGNVSSCARSLFIFDEVDKMPENVLNAITPFIDYHDNVDKIDYRKAIFIFLSNTGGTIIKDHLITLWEKGVKREDIKLSDFEHLITKGAFNEEGGFHYSDTIKSNLIDHYIPFLPMERKHVELCIRDEFKKRNVFYPGEECIGEVLESVEWGPEPMNLFSSTGCKRISQKVPVVAQKYRYLKFDSNKREDL